MKNIDNISPYCVSKTSALEQTYKVITLHILSQILDLSPTGPPPSLGPRILGLGPRDYQRAGYQMIKEPFLKLDTCETWGQPSSLIASPPDLNCAKKHVWLDLQRSCRENTTKSPSAIICLLFWGKFVFLQCWRAFPPKLWQNSLVANSPCTSGHGHLVLDFKHFAAICTLSARLL